MLISVNIEGSDSEQVKEGKYNSLTQAGRNTEWSTNAIELGFIALNLSQFFTIHWFQLHWQQFLVGKIEAIANIIHMEIQIIPQPAPPCRCLFIYPKQSDVIRFFASFPARLLLVPSRSFIRHSLNNATRSLIRMLLVQRTNEMRKFRSSDFNIIHCWMGMELDSIWLHVLTVDFNTIRAANRVSVPRIWWTENLLNWRGEKRNDTLLQSRLTAHFRLCCRWVWAKGISGHG